MGEQDGLESNGPTCFCTLSPQRTASWQSKVEVYRGKARPLYPVLIEVCGAVASASVRCSVVGGMGSVFARVCSGGHGLSVRPRM